MIVKNCAFTPSSEAGVFGFARLELASYTGETVVIDECQLIINKQGRLRLAIPPFVVFSESSFLTRNLPATIRKDIEATVLHEFEGWLQGAR